MKLSTIKPNPANPRTIKDAAFEKLCKSITEFPKMMALRPMVIDADGVILGGNMRFKALQHLGFKEVPDEWVKRADELTEDERRRFIIADNVSGGDWDVEDLAANWDREELDAWGVEVDWDKAIDKSSEGDVIDLGIKQSIQVLPKNDYIIITEPEGSDEWEELKTIFKCETVRSGGCKIGSTSDKVGTGTERVFNLKTFKERVGL
jgi:hypothetical protein